MALPVADTAAQLPPEIQADRYLLQADEQFAKEDAAVGKRALDRILKLKDQHDLKTPESFFFRYAQVLEGAALYDEAIQFVTRYLTLAGRDGSHYREALRLLNTAVAAEAVADAAVEAARQRAVEIRKRAEAAIRRAEVGVAAMEFVPVPAGSFRMGSTGWEAPSDERPLTRVVISRAFHLGKF